MSERDRWRAILERPAVEWALFVLGVLLIILSPIAGIIPGPGGIFVFAAGLALVLRTSMWAKRRYVHFKRWQPKAGRWADWGLRRRSALRREARLKETRHRGQRELAGVPEGQVSTIATAEGSEPLHPVDAAPMSASELAEDMDARLRGSSPTN